MKKKTEEEEEEKWSVRELTKRQWIAVCLPGESNPETVVVSSHMIRTRMKREAAMLADWDGETLKQLKGVGGQRRPSCQ